MDLKELSDKISALKWGDILETIRGWDKKTWITIIAGIAGFLFFVVFVFYPGWVKRPALKKHNAEVFTQMARLKALNAKKPQLEKQKQEIQSLVDGFQKKLFTEEETAFLLGRISKLAQDAQIELLASKPFSDVEEFPDPYSKKYKKYVYQITVQGSYHQIASFVSLLESYKQYFQIQMLGIVPQLKTPGKHISDIKLMAVSHNVTEAKA